MNFSKDEAMIYNFPVLGTFDLANAALKLDAKTVLDIGFGAGGASILFGSNNRRVTAIGLGLDSYGYPQDEFSKLGIRCQEISFEDFKSEEKFDLIWASHVLEHTLNVGHFLDKCHELLVDDGWLCVLVPPFKNEVVGGHVSNGWNIGQLMYSLLLAGYDIKNGHFVHHGYNLCAFVQKSKRCLPSLRMDIGDIEMTADYWPLEVKQGFNGALKQVNWFADFKTYEIDKARLDSLQEQNVELKKRLENENALINKIRIEVREQREKLKALHALKPASAVNLYVKNKHSKLFLKLQFLKKIPVVGRLALFVKRKIFS